MRRPVFGRSVYKSERSAGARGRAREELKTLRPGAATRERFLEGGGEKRFGVAAGGAMRFWFRPRGSLPLVPGFGDPSTFKICLPFVRIRMQN
jgi:hypothetical protein